MRGRFNARACTILAAALASVPVLAHAQPAGTWSLPEPDATSAPRAQGPIDAQNPVIGPAAPPADTTDAPGFGSAPAPIPTITPIPVITPPAAPRESGTAPPAAAGRTFAPPPEAQPRPENGQQPAPTATTALPPFTSDTQAPSSRLGDSAPPQPSATEPAGGTWPAWWWGAVPAALVIAIALFLFRRRRSQTLEWQEQTRSPASPEPEPETLAAEPQAAASPQAASLLPLPTPTFTPPAAPAAPPPEPIAIDFEPVAVRLSLFYATLQYRISLKSSGAQPPLELLGDLISAHGSLTREEQLAPHPDGLPVLHTLPGGLMPGETAELKGEVQLPLTRIRAVRRGGGSFLVPLARFCLIGADGTALRRVFTLGLPGGEAGLVPLRIDAGPRTFESLAAREIEAARVLPVQSRSLPLDPQRAAG